MFPERPPPTSACSGADAGKADADAQANAASVGGVDAMFSY